VIFLRTSTEISAANTITPAWRVASVVSSVPRRREPDTKSARPDRIGSTSRSISSASYWPSASMVTITFAPRARANQ
jgi:hypothetical protein